MDNCPNCGVSLIGDPIPEDIRHHYCDETHWRRDISIYSRQLDRTIAYRCPDCKHTWPRDDAPKPGQFRTRDVA